MEFKMVESYLSCFDVPNSSDFWIQYLVCNACNKPLLPPLYFCQNSSNAHPLCTSCTQCKLSHCSSKISTVRCLLLEKFLPLIKFACEYQCNSEPLNVSEYRDHISNCHLRPICCSICSENVNFRRYFDHLLSKHKMREKYRKHGENFCFDILEGQPEMQYTEMDNKIFLFRYENCKFWIEVLTEEEDAHLDYFGHVIGIRHKIDQKIKIFNTRTGKEVFYSPRYSVSGLLPCVMPAEDEQLSVEIFQDQDDNSISSAEYFDADESDIPGYVHQVVGNVNEFLTKRSSLANFMVHDVQSLKLQRQPAVLGQIYDSGVSDSPSNDAMSSLSSISSPLSEQFPSSVQPFLESFGPSNNDGTMSYNQLKSSSNKNSAGKRIHVLAEIIATEEAYVLDTGEVLSGYGEQVVTEDLSLQSLLPPQLQKHSYQTANEDGGIIRVFCYNKFLFSNLEQIHEFHKTKFLPKLIDSNGSIELIGRCFVDVYEEFFTLYSQYCQTLPSIKSLSKEIGENHPWMEHCRQRLKHRLTLDSYLLKPVQRITKYQLLLKDLIKCSEGMDGYSVLLDALDRMLNILRSVDNGMLQLNIVDYPDPLQDEGPILLQAPFTVWTEHDRLRIAGHPRHLFLYSNCILICKKDKYPTNNTLHYKSKINMDEIGLTETLNGHGPTTRFELWTPGRVKVWNLQAETNECKDIWVAAIKKILMEQLKSAKKSYTPKLMSLNVVAAI